MSAAEHVGQAQQLKMFMTPREIMEDYGPHDSQRWITATEQPDGIGRLGPQRSIPPMMITARPAEFGIVTPFDDPRTEADNYAERWHAAKAKYDRGEGNDPITGQDASYEPGDPAPGTPEFTQEHSPWSVEDHPDWTDREHYLDSWGGDITELKDEMKSVGYTGNIDDYVDEEKRQHYESAKAQKIFNLEDVHDPSTWFEGDEQYWARTLEHAKRPTEELANAARDEGEPQMMSMFPAGLGAYASVEGMGVEKPVILGLDPEVNVRGQIKRTLWGGEHDLISAYETKPDALIPVEHTGKSGSTYGMFTHELFPPEERRAGRQGDIAAEKDRIVSESHADDPEFRLSEEEEQAFWDVQPPKSIPGQQSLF